MGINEFNIHYMNGYVMCTVQGLWLNGIGNNIQEAIQDFIKDYNELRG